MASRVPAAGAGFRHQLQGQFRLRTEVGWALFAAMVLCCLCLALGDLPDSWRPLQNIAALVQAFASGIVATLFLPIWDREKAASGERANP
jgi:hypothetical protein